MEQPKIPTLKDSQKPQVKIKGLAAGMSLFDRLKQFKKKDLAFILAGLGTLFMAPLAEHFMMAPESGGDTMQAGWGGKGGRSLFGDGTSPYESGITGLAPGGAIGGGGDVITPLNVRDPSALVMGPGAQQQPPAGSLAPQAPSTSAKEPDLKDAIANAAARAAGAATRRAPVPVPKPGMNNSGLRGLGVVSGGSSAGAGLGPISSNNLAPRGAAGSNSLGSVRPASGYRGVAGARGPGKGGGGAEDLKKAAGGVGDLFNKGGASGALETAAASQMGGGSAFGGSGGGGAGGNDKGPGGNNSPGSKSIGESLEFLRKKQEMEKAMDLKWKMKEKRTMFPIELGQKAAETALMKGLVEPLAGSFGELVKSKFSPGSKTGLQCQTANGTWETIPGGCMDGAIAGRRDGAGKCTPANDLAGRKCQQVTFPGQPADGETTPPPGSQVGGGITPPGALTDACAALDGSFIPRQGASADDTATRNGLLAIGKQAMTVQMTLSGGAAGAAANCGGSNLGGATDAGIVALQTNGKSALGKAGDSLEWGLRGLKYGVEPVTKELDQKIADAKAATAANGQEKFGAVSTLYEGTGKPATGLNPFEGMGAKKGAENAQALLVGKQGSANLGVNAELADAKAIVDKSKATLDKLKALAPEGFSKKITEYAGKLPAGGNAQEIYTKLKTQAEAQDAALSKAIKAQTALEAALGDATPKGAFATAKKALDANTGLQPAVEPATDAATLAGLAKKMTELKGTIKDEDTLKAAVGQIPTTTGALTTKLKSGLTPVAPIIDEAVKLNADVKAIVP